MNKRSFLPACTLVLLAACGAPSNPEHEKMMSDMKAMMAADSSKMAVCNANKEAMQKVFTMFETGNTEGIENIVADNIVSHVPPMPGTTSTGITRLKEMITSGHHMWPDAKWAITSMAAEGNMVFAHYHMTGTIAAGSMGPGMPAENKPIDINGVDIVRYENGKGVEHWGYWEEEKMNQQMGLEPAPGEAGKKDEKKK